MAGRYKITNVDLKTHGQVKVYAGLRVSEALRVLMNMNMYEGVKVWT